VRPVRLTGIETRILRIPLVAPFQTSFGTETVREVIVLRAVTDQAEGWGECVTQATPAYSAEYTEGAWDVLQRFLVPAVLAGETVRPDLVSRVLRPVAGQRMPKAALELALLDAALRASGESFAEYLGAVRTRVPAGVSVGIQPSLDQLLGVVGEFLDEGYVRIKLKIQPGWDTEPVRLVREAFGPHVWLQVDANAAYTLSDHRHLARLDEYDLLLIEQPLGEDDLRQHAELARRLRTPICLDETIVSAQRAFDAIALGAAQVINIKAGRVGGYLEARRIHDVAAAAGVPAWCGGMVETGIGRAANVALAALPGCTLPGDVSASARFYERDIITAPFTLDGGQLSVPTGPGLGVEVDSDALEDFSVRRTWTAAG
jgi:o-succinylbenzoate synthase